ncbi:MAG: hypothetical protein ABIT04_13650 [Novosphingobium sp.]
MAEPGLAGKVYGARLEPGTTELEARYGRLTGGAQDGDDALILEAAHHFSEKFYAAVLLETGRPRQASRSVDAIAVEGIVHLARIEALGLDVAAYGEYGFDRGGPNAAETKLLLQHQAGTFDGRLNLIAEKTLRSGEEVEIGYAASADWALAGKFRAGAAAFGEFEGRRHYVGPIVKTEIEHLPLGGELEIETGYLFAVGNARHDSQGQARLLLEYEFVF